MFEFTKEEKESLENLANTLNGFSVMWNGDECFKYFSAADSFEYIVDENKEFIACKIFLLLDICGIIWFDTYNETLNMSRCENIFSIKISKSLSEIISHVFYEHFSGLR